MSDYRQTSNFAVGAGCATFSLLAVAASAAVATAQRNATLRTLAEWDAYYAAQECAAASAQAAEAEAEAMAAMAEYQAERALRAYRGRDM